ncbi:olfactory receptor 1C1-like [Rana temporaria]|uniref:olfactory receptor 1C1-like n=1 Tax=Rana temporaria TaxID=8407 RepID=UPI001AACF266|nr:olfactory receptor 1C1-like [Rana temporaria]
MRNETSLPQFILLGLSDLGYSQIPLSLLILLVYVATLVGNLLIISLVVTDSHLRTPMYFLLGNLSVLDILTPSVSASHLSFDIFTGNTIISYSTCITQVFFFIWLVCTEVFLLAVMSYDRYVAICHPLHYTTMVNIFLCVQMMSGICIFSSMYSLVHTLSLLRLVFCDSTIIPGFFCELYQLIQLSCSDTSLNILLLSLLGVGFPFIAFSITFFSYVFIFKTILRIKMLEGKLKAFSTCSSHLTVVFIFYSASYFNYFHPKTKGFLVDRLLSTIYTIVTPFLNPVIYSLRNSDLKGAIHRALVRVGFRS